MRSWYIRHIAFPLYISKDALMVENRREVPLGLEGTLTGSWPGLLCLQTTCD